VYLSLEPTRKQRLLGCRTDAFDALGDPLRHPRPHQLASFVRRDVSLLLEAQPIAQIAANT
jgi:hypothetical protein